VARLSYPGCSILLTLRVYLRFPVHFACSLLNLVGQFAKPAGSLAYLIGQAATLGNLVLYPDQQFDVFGHDLSLKGALPKSNGVRTGSKQATTQLRRPHILSPERQNAAINRRMTETISARQSWLAM
jgi:hypothetical protein